MDDRQKNKAHRALKSGRKAEKKSTKDANRKAVSQAGMTAKQRNPKAFSVQNVARLRKTVRRTMDLKEKKMHDPVVDRTSLEPPPIIVAIVGPPKVGKSTLMRGLIKNFTSQKLTDIKGPVTVVSGKKRRLTFIECNNDMNAMIDVAKIADLVLLLIDASFGMEMETFEFLNICQVHGFPKIMGVLTHLDYFKNNKKLKTTRKTLKHRFWTEIYQGAKLFYLSGMMYGEYLKNEIHNLARFISVMKFRPLTWRNSHPYLLADRIEDITDPEKLRLNQKVSRNLCFYGYMRGVPLKNKSTMHIPGCGDYVLADVSHLPDPCPLPDTVKRRSLNDFERKLYAPMSGVGGIVYDKDAVYIDMADKKSKKTGSKSNVEDEDEEAEEQLKEALMSTQQTLEDKLTLSELSIFSDGKAIRSDQFKKPNLKIPKSHESVKEDGRVRRRAVFDTPDINVDEEADDSDEEESGDEFGDEEVIIPDGNRMDAVNEDEEEEGHLSYEEDDSDGNDSDYYDNDALEEEEDEEEDPENQEEISSHLKWKDNLAAKAAVAFLNRQKSAPNLRKLVYDIGNVKEDTTPQKEEKVAGLFTVVSKSQQSSIDDSDFTRLLVSSARDWTKDEVRSLIKDCFVTGEWEASKDAQKQLEEDDAMYGDFEDLEKESGDEGEGDDGSGESYGEEEDTIDNDEDKMEEPLDGNTQRSKKITAEDRKKKMEAKRLAKKERIKEMFDAEYDRMANGDGPESYFDARKAELDAQAKLNRSEFDGMDDNLRVLYEGYRSGLYVRIEIHDIPAEFMIHFDPTYPVLLGGMTSTETVIGCLQARFKKHRWFKKILKTKDPVVFSLGWRRFQSIPLYTIQDHNGRNRHLKYTPEHMYCQAIFWGPSTPQNTGFMCIQNFSSEVKGFRVAATGVILSQDKSISVTKKLKLIGYPSEIHNKTAFIKDMFNSPLEVAKFGGAKIKTVSGIRGQVKKALRAPPGAFRATFEDRILMSDIVFLKTWFQVEIPKYYNPVTNLLMSREERQQWSGMKTLGNLRKEKGLKAPFVEDSQYQKEPVRKEHHLKPLEIPRKLQQNLPFNYKPKVRGQWEDPVLSKRVAVVRDSHEKRRDQLINRLQTIAKAKKIQARESAVGKRREHRKKLKALEEVKDNKRKVMRKDLYRQLGKVKQAQHARKMRHGEKME